MKSNIVLKFWNKINNRPAKIFMSGVICPACQKGITQEDIDKKLVSKYPRSFDLYHKSCYTKPTFNFMCIDEAKEIEEGDMIYLDEQSEREKR